jgi:hypothetical protein
MTNASMTKIIDALLPNQSGFFDAKRQTSSVARAEHPSQVWSERIYFCNFLSFSHFSSLGFLKIYVHTYIPLTLNPRRGSNGISDVRHPRFSKIS